MCGYTGYINTKKKNKKIIKEMNEKIYHRGPDSEGFFTDEFLHMGFRRLSIIDLNGGNQPIYNEEKNLVLLFNGEIYNFMSIREDLIEKGHKFLTNTDSEVVIHGYEEYKEKILDKLRGMFSFVIWDINKKELFAARDMFGIKPFYYGYMNDTFLFGSEIKSFLPNPNFKKELNNDALKTYLTFQYNPMEETFFKGIFKLKPGHYLRYKDGNYEVSKYFNFKFKEKEYNEEEIANKINEYVKESVEYHKISDVKVGAFLSSGIDSSYIVSLLKPNKTFSVGFDFDGFNETIDAKRLSDLLKIQNKKKLIKPDEFFKVLSKVQYYSDEPHANLSSVPLYFLSKLAKKDVTVVLSGEGADEFFGGYSEYSESNLLINYRKLPKVIKNFNKLVAEKLPNIKGKSFLIKGAEDISDYYIGQAFVYSDEEANDILTDKYKTSIRSKDITKPYFDEVKGLDDITRKQYVDVNLWLPNDILLKADKMTMAHSLELRVPFLDKEVFKLACTLKYGHKVKNGVHKYALRKAASKSIPEEWFNRSKKGFLVPFREYLKDEKYYNIVKKEFESDYAKEFFDVDKLINLLDLHYENKMWTHRKVYTAYSFLLWYKEYFINN